VPAAENSVTTVRLGERGYVLAVGGELDMHTVEPLREQLETLRTVDRLQLVVDLARVSFVDSIALGVLVEAAKRARSGGGEVVVVSDDPRVRRVFEITGLDRMVRVERSLAETVEQLVVASSS
jgi:anti-sigma B factor antagonist